MGAIMDKVVTELLRMRQAEKNFLIQGIARFSDRHHDFAVTTRQDIATLKGKLTAAGLPIKIVNLNNKYMGMVRQWQQFFHGNRYSESYMDALPDFVKLAEGYGHRGMLVEKPADVEPALREAFANKKELVFLDFITDQTENVYPMIPGGKGNTEMILSEEL
jgi:thiamine pyrophosphate-dependent acetolactate synthase large subunit-like protein